ncbi:MAG: hypothetical protein KC550_00015 [Nanoarchaeota archaeon]|nr:hypothetical protein [Nanoarchaeota archaeon]
MLKISSKFILKFLAIYSTIIISLISFLVLASETSTVHEKAIIKMALGMIFFWIIMSGSLMYHFRDRFKALFQSIPIKWQIKFILFCTFFALFEEVITVTMTNLAPFFGSELGKSFMTASANYLHTVLFHSVIVFIPMFCVLAYLLSKYNFKTSHIFLLFGLVGSIAEMSMNPTNILAGIWFFVYGLMVFLPTYSIPENRNTIEPKIRHYFLAIILILISPILLLPFSPILMSLCISLDPVFFVETLCSS